MDDTTLKRLMFTKRLFLHGVYHSNNNTELDRFVAIHHFDNSIELFLKIVATQENIISTIRQDFVFKDLWNEVNTKLGVKIPSYILPLKDQLFNLHETRNLAQHQGDAPSFESVIKYQGYVKDFLTKSFKDIFNVEFEKVYASTLIREERIREALVEAEKNIESSDFKESMKFSAKAFAYLKRKERGDFSSEKLKRFITFELLDTRNIFRISDIHSSDRTERQICDNVNRSLKSLAGELEDKLNESARKINEFAELVEEEIAILKLGVDYKAFKLFSKIRPHTIFREGSTEPRVYDTKEENYTEQNALFCYDLVLELALRLQSLDNETERPQNSVIQSLL